VKIYLASLGSRGDNEPFRALAAEASAAGHEVVFAHTTDVPTDPGASYTELPLGGSIESVIAAHGISVVKALLAYPTTVKPLLEGAYTDVVTQIRDLQPDVVVYHPKLVTAPVAAHSVGAIAVCVEMFPTLTATSEFPALGFPHGMPGFLNRASFSILRAGLGAFGNPARKSARELGVVGIEPDLTLCPVSEVLVPQPADWPDFAVVTGHWATPSSDGVDAELEEFLSSGPIVYAGFGSMKDSRAEKRAQVIVRAAREMGFKTLLVTGWGGLEPTLEHVTSSDVMVRESVPHSAVLPHIGVAIHHGGAGTTHAMLRAGVPSVIMPFLADQPWWAERLRRAGLAPAPLSRSVSDPRTVAGALVTAITLADAVKAASARMALEDGVGRALSLLEDAEAGMIPLGPA
jgi:sterol 3beta-glucosyltransferase